MGRALLTDLYELNMARSYLRRQMNAPATFSLFVRRLPASRGFLVAMGMDDCVDYLEHLRFEEDDLDYLSSIGFPPETLEALSSLRFTGDVWSVGEGRIVFAGEPILEVTAPIAEAQLAETYLLNKVTFQTALATKAARCIVAAEGGIDLVDFSFRRTQGVEAALAAARASAIVGFKATSNVEAARSLGLHPSGTMAHSYVEAFPDELAAFRAFATDLPESVTLLVDTYDSVSGIRNAIAVIRELGIGPAAAIRIDSGDLTAVSVAARKMLDEADLNDVRIVVSGSLDEHRIQRLVAARAPVDAAGVGTRMGVSADAPYLDSVYKLVSYDGRPTLKTSPDKATLPGAKQIFRRPGLVDTIALRDEPVPDATQALLEPVMQGGKRLAEAESLEAKRRRFEADLGELSDLARDLTNPQAHVAAHSEALVSLEENTRARLLS